MVQAMAGQAGFKLSLRPTEYAAMLAESSKGNFQMDMRGWSGRVDPDGNIFSFVTCKGTLNDGKYCNPKVDELLRKARTDRKSVVQGKRVSVRVDLGGRRH